MQRSPEGSALTLPFAVVLLALPPGIGSILPLVLIPVVFYFKHMRPNQQKQKQCAQMLAGLHSGDRITTTGGIRGTIFALREDSIQIRVAPDGVKLEIARNAIAAVTTDEDRK